MTAEFADFHTTCTELLATFDGDSDFLREIVDMFVDRCPVLLEQIRVGFHGGDAGAVSCAAHSLKGSLGYFGHGEASGLAVRLERITSAELPCVPALLVQLERHVTALIGQLREEFPDAG